MAIGYCSRMNSNTARNSNNIKGIRVIAGSFFSCYSEGRMKTDMRICKIFELALNSY